MVLSFRDVHAFTPHIGFVVRLQELEVFRVRSGK
jgi:hypothetical protein